MGWASALLNKGCEYESSEEYIMISIFFLNDLKTSTMRETKGSEVKNTRNKNKYNNIINFIL